MVHVDFTYIINVVFQIFFNFLSSIFFYEKEFNLYNIDRVSSVSNTKDIFDG